MDTLSPLARLICTVLAGLLAGAASLSAGGGWPSLLVFPVCWVLFYAGVRVAWQMARD